MLADQVQMSGSLLTMIAGPPNEKKAYIGMPLDGRLCKASAYSYV